MLVASALIPLSLVTNASNTGNNDATKYPWLDYLVQLAKEQGRIYDKVTLIIITRHDAAIQKHTRELFLQSEVAKALNITELKFVQIGPALWTTYLERAVKRGIQYDIAWGGGPTIFDLIDQEGYVLPLNPNKHPEFKAVLDEASKLPERFAGAPTMRVGDDGFIHWIGAAVASFGFTVNKAKANEYNVPIPQTWEDLGSPVYAKYLPDKPLIGMADPTKSTSNTRMYEIILQAYGWEQGWIVITTMAANGKIYDASDRVRDAVTVGDIVAGLTIDFYGYTAMKQNPDCEYVIPKGLTIINADPIAILKTTKYPIRAAAFVAWVLSEYGGQQVWLFDDVNRLPINPYTFNVGMGPQRQDLKNVWETIQNVKGIDFDDERALSWERAMQYYFVATLVDLHTELQSVWASIAKAYLNGKITEEQFEELKRMLGSPLEFKDPVSKQTIVFDEEAAKTINEKLSDSQLLNAYKVAWEEAARARYEAVKKKLDEFIQGTATTPTSTQTTQTSTPTEEGKRSNVVVIAVVIVIILIMAYALLSRRK
ncbi:MAG: ABC transporter substrate-binding protein [Desulfurococcales archaeon]|nr:ABC transporter substrate-binding protein [Desulfurococcales archaeon]